MTRILFRGQLSLFVIFGLITGMLYSEAMDVRITHAIKKEDIAMLIIMPVRALTEMPIT